MSIRHNKQAATILKNIIYITLATVTPEGKPWNSPLYSTYDQDLNFYWSSDKKGVHSNNVRDNNEAFIVIYDSTVPEGTGEGVYMIGKAYELADKDEILIARTTTQSRKGKKPGKNELIKFTGDSIRRVYKFVPSKIWMNDVELDANGNYIKDVRIEISASDLKKLIK